MRFSKITRLPLYYFLYKKDINRAYWDRLIDEFTDDFLNYKNTSIKQKIWAYKRGFVSERINRFQLTEDNYMEYISDVAYCKKSAFKNSTYYWFDDKLTTWYILSPFIEYLPMHYYSICNGNIRQLYNGNKDIHNNVDGIIKLLQEKKELAIKEINGHNSIGFYKINFDGSSYKINNNEKTISQIRDFVSKLNNHIITEFIHTHKDLKKIYELTANTIRLITIYDESEGAKVTGSYIRFGTSKTGVIEDIYNGGVFCGVTLEEGKMYNPLTYKGKELVSCPIHPDTGVNINGQIIPNWKLIINKATEISNYLNNTPYLTYDIVATDDGFKILEINSHGVIKNLQIFYPFLRNKYQRKLFQSNQ